MHMVYDSSWEVVPGHPLTRRRLEKGLSMPELATLAGVDHSSISRIEGGKVRRPWGKTVRALAKVLRCRPLDITQDEETA